MANFKVKDKKIIPEFVGSLMKAVARRGAGKTIKKLEKDPVIRKNLEKIRKIDNDLQDYIKKQSEESPEFKKNYSQIRNFMKSL